MSNKLFWVDEDDMEKTRQKANPDEEKEFVQSKHEEGIKSVKYHIPVDAEDRGGWGHKLDFLMSCISLSVGLGNVWRFPYLCYKNGGGAFLVTYSVAMVVCGIPLFFQEVAIGQYLGSGGMTFVGHLCPILKGVGFATMTIVFLLDVYYCIIIAWTLFYILSTFSSLPELPWQDCGNWWNTKNCYSSGSNISLIHINRTSPVEEFFDRKVLGISNGLEEIGGMQWNIFVCLVIGWILVYTIIRKGLHQSGKIIWFSALFPYVILIIMMVRAVTLEGAGDGLLYYVIPRWETLLTPGPWMDGASQIFFAYSIGCGALPALGSYNKFHHNSYNKLLKSTLAVGLLFACLWMAVAPKRLEDPPSFFAKIRSTDLGLQHIKHSDMLTETYFQWSKCGVLCQEIGIPDPLTAVERDAIITCVVNTLTSVLAGIVTFSILGHLAREQNANVEDVVKSGPGLVFLTYPEVVLKLPGAPFWAATFFLMLLLLGIDSAFCLVESFITGLLDNWSTLLRPHRQTFTTVVCFVMFLLGIPMVTHGGMYVFQLMDYYSASGMSLLWVCFFQTVAISWVFGVDKLCDCIEQMMGIRPNIFWRFCWKYCAPTVIAAVFVQQCMEYETLRYGEYKYPLWANIIGLGISFSSMLWVPAYALYYVCTQPNSVIQNFKAGIIPTIKQRKISICDKATGQLITQSKVGLITPSTSLVQNEKIET